ncbi:hypothetical protein C1H46_017839 [Malus baccata]|uniref:Uncharacterized protein n=1 Tax=Malus baccata TaxID=106549 RepID=A0A540MCN6_MALBA|nr:hypothetical protein C1H46_017839 [Malus baccata]
MVAHKRQIDLEVETMKRKTRVVIMHTSKKNVDGDMVDPNGVDVIQACLNRIELGTALETQANEDDEDKYFVVMQHIAMDDEIRYQRITK